MYDAEIILGKMPPWLVTWIRDKKLREIKEMMEWVVDHLFNSTRPLDPSRHFQQRGDHPTKHGPEKEQKPISAVKREAEQKSGKKQQTDEGTKPWHRPKFDPRAHVASPVMSMGILRTPAQRKCNRSTSLRTNHWQQ